jgi:uncharacterized protein DUF4259
VTTSEGCRPWENLSGPYQATLLDGRLLNLHDMDLLRIEHEPEERRYTLWLRWAQGWLSDEFIGTPLARLDLRSARVIEWLEDPIELLPPAVSRQISVAAFHQPDLLHIRTHPLRDHCRRVGALVRAEQGGIVGTWGSGPFDDDTAADWAGDLNEASPEDRPGIVLDTLRAVIDESDYIESEVGVQAIAAAAIVAMHRPGGEQFESVYAPDFIEAGERLNLAPDIAPLALQALERVAGDESEWSELWQEAPDGPADALAMVERLREVLAR